MRILIEIAIIILAGVIIYFIITSKNGDISNFENQNEIYKDSIEKLNDELSNKEKLNDSLKQSTKKLESISEKLKKQSSEIQKNYSDSIEQIKSKSIAELVGDTGKFTNDSAHVIVDTNQYRQFRKNEIVMKKLDAQLKICREGIKTKDQIIEYKNLRLANYESQIKTYKNKSRQKDKIIKNKDNQIKATKKEIRRQKLEKWGIAGGAAVVVGLVLLL